MLELLLLIGGLVALWKFSGAISAFATGTRSQAEAYSEGIIQDSVIDRVDQMEEFEERLAQRNIISHEEVLTRLKVK